MRHTGGLAQRIGRGGALAPQRLRGPRARRLALGGGSGGVSAPAAPPPQAPPLHEAVGGRRRARFGARVHLPRGGRARRGSRIAEAAPSALRDGLAAQGRGATQGRRAQPERPGRPGESAKGQGLQGFRPPYQGDGKSKGASPRPGQKSSGLRAEQGSASRGEGVKAGFGRLPASAAPSPASPRPTAARARARARASSRRQRRQRHRKLGRHLHS